jgi:hypothetical protein
MWYIVSLLGNNSKKETTIIARKQFRKYGTVFRPLLGSGPRATSEILLEAAFSM